ncbi:CapA family protein [Undibacterium sp. CY18W]|uniref:CapA family protein n=1 Tax=Undibacterium hunanense TaxID=2762292 RepID=A0ABR6ZJ35_9BURK|nr:CapA family protein [Undibacterium hunanense]MBC3915883.1 CapA family protein [Undibacterium hunanense]
MKQRRRVVWPALFAMLLGLFCQTSAAQTGGHHILLTGQVMLQHNLATYDAPGYANNVELQKIRRQLDSVFALMRSSDTVILELESALKIDSTQAREVEPGRDKDSDFFHEVDRDSIVDLITRKIRFAPNQAMFAAANNHVSDNGVPGITSLITLFQDLNIPLAGVGDELAASAPRYLPVKSGKLPGQQLASVALIAFATDKVKLQAKKTAVGVNTLSVTDDTANTVNSEDRQRIEQSIAKARKQQAIVVAYHHNHHWNQKQVNLAGGIEQWRLDFAHYCIERGADVYFSHGEPRLQGIEIYQGKPIFYGLGNFFFQTRKVNFYQPEVWESVMAELEYDDANPHTIRSIKLTPVVLNENGAQAVFMQTRGLPALADDAQARKILTTLQSLSEKFGTRIDIDDSNPAAIVGRIRIAKAS